jgi:hypothetical protein
MSLSYYVPMIVYAVCGKNSLKFKVSTERYVTGDICHIINIKLTTTNLRKEIAYY